MTPASESCLLEVIWDVPDLGPLRVVWAVKQWVNEIDKSWPPRRPSGDSTQNWVWADLVKKTHSKFVVINSNNVAIAIWCSSKHKPLKLPDGLFYRLDFLEIAPEFRGTVLSAFIFALVASRALELQCQGLVLSTFPIDGIREYYKGAGGEERAPQGWHYPKELIPFTFNSKALTFLGSTIDGLKQR